jgi:thiosulfate dehydrogenase [quinone] large subunit
MNNLNNMTTHPPYSRGQLISLIILRTMIGWHFLYEGLSKLVNPYWSSAGYLLESKWLFSYVSHTILANPTLLKIVDILNIWGLILIGIGLIAGLFTQFSTIAGIVLLTLYYLANPPLIGLQSALPKEGSYLIVDKNLIELAALVVLAIFPTGKLVGLDLFIRKIK